MLGSLFLAAFLILANGFFVAAEFALVKVRSTQLDVRAAGGDRLAALARSILNHLDAYLSATQLGITLSSLGLGWVGEPVMERLLAPALRLAGLDHEASHSVSAVAGFAIISFLHIVVGEVAPKSLAIAKAETTSVVVAAPMRVFYLLFWPALMLLNASSNLLLRSVGIEPVTGHSLAVPAEELEQIAAESAAGGQLTAAQGLLLSNVFRFSDRVAREIMVPRSKVRGIDLRRPIEEALGYALENGHSRYPLYERDLDGIIGILHMKDLMPRLASRQLTKSLRELARPAIFVPETMPAQRLLRTFQRQRSHMAIVLDEFGGVTGVVTLEDNLEELVGDIQDEHDEERQPVEPIDQGFSVEGRLSLSEVEALLEAEEIESGATTLSGYIMERLGRVAQVGDSVPIDGWTARVTQVEHRSIERVELIRRAEATSTT
jgi:CBS domain containing-hemolysin-like protein